MTGQFANGLRWVIRPMAGATECCGLTVNTGSRDELDEADHGLAHFVEHTIFKGTTRRSGTYVLNRMEQVGGELNAFTTKEETTVYALMPEGNVERATRLIGELTCESVFPDKGLTLEREVVCDEIDSYLDTPSEAAFDIFDEIAYAGNPLAHNILGTKQTVDALTGERCRRYLRERFTADNAVWFYAGPTRPDIVLRTAEKAFAAMVRKCLPIKRISPQASAPFIDVRHSDLHQCHTVMGAPTGGLHSPTRHITALAVNILGGPGMNALLNMELRERRGLVYTVEASTALYTDCGMMNIYFGCDHHDLKRCQTLVNRTLERMALSTMSQQRLNAAKRQYLGQVTLAHDNKEQLALSTARSVLHGLQPPMLHTTAERINSITPEQLRTTFEHLAQAPRRTLSLT